ncbi:plasmid stabilization system protein ParE [Bradyrhizobium sp. USDA 4503]
MKLVWSRFALSDRDDIFSYIEAENPRAAVHVDEQIADAARRLLDFPVAGPGVLPARASWSSRAHLMSRRTLLTVRLFASCACFTVRRCGPTNLQMTIEAAPPYRHLTKKKGTSPGTFSARPFLFSPCGKKLLGHDAIFAS